METTFGSLGGSALPRQSLDAIRNGTPAVCSPPIRVDGKWFARAAGRLRVRGVTYGPFAPDDKGDPFPAPDRVS
jgi:hypothetical protein